MNVVLFLLAIILLLLAHLVKIERQSQFIEIYEKPPKSALSKALAITFLFNFLLPFKIGNIFRITYPGKFMKNGKSFSLATIFVDILIDFFTITILYLILSLIKINVDGNEKFYLTTTISIICLLILLFIFKNTIKRKILKIASVFNENIKLKLLKTTWFSITAFKDMLIRINKVKLISYTVLSSVLYISSYICLVAFFTNIEIKSDFISIFNMMYGRDNLMNPTIFSLWNSVETSELMYLIIYIVIPIILIYLMSYLYKFVYKRKNEKEKGKEYIKLMPYMNFGDSLVFLEDYFSAEKAEFLREYINLNRKIAIIQNYSAGSNATTMLCSKDGETFYRKYSFGNDAEKLNEQIKWIKMHQDKLELTQIIKEYYNNGVCFYDMPYIPNSVTCFNYVHTNQLDDSWMLLKQVLDDIDRNLHILNRRKVDDNILDEYIKQKVIKNIEKIKNAQYIKPFLKYDYIYINGNKYNNLPHFEKYLNKQYLKEIFKNDFNSDIHGDFTIENIICLKQEDKNKKGYYIIDPNTGNIHDSPYLDYAKLLQSLHGGYEFLMNTKNISYCDNKLDFLFTKSNIYCRLYENYIEYLSDKFGKDGLKSIFYHEIIHWIRLMPYKISKLGDKALLFYAGLIMVANDVEKRFEKE